MPQHRIAISGGRGSGKSTCFQALIERMNKRQLSFSGFKTFFLNAEALWLEWINRSESTILMSQKTGKQSMRPVLENLDKIGKRLMQIEWHSKCFVADEIGFLEQLSKRLQRGIYKAVTDAPFSIFTIKNVDYPFLKQLKKLERIQIVDLDPMDWQQKDAIIKSLLGELDAYQSPIMTKISHKSP